VPSHCVHSVLDIRQFLSTELDKLDSGSEFAASLREMRGTFGVHLARIAAMPSWISKTACLDPAGSG